MSDDNTDTVSRWLSVTHTPQYIYDTPALKEEPYRLDEVNENITWERELRKGRTPPPGKLPVWRSRRRPNTRIR